MLSKRQIKFIFLEAGLLVVSAFIVTFLISDYFDESRINQVEERLYESNLDQESSFVSNVFFESIKEDSCDLIKENIQKEFELIDDISVELGTYDLLASPHRDRYFSIKKREQILNQLDLYFKAKDYNEACNGSFYPVLYFVDGDSEEFDRQALILEQFRRNNEDRVLVFTFDDNFEDEPSLNQIKRPYNISEVPFIIMGDTTSRELGEGVISLDVLEEVYRES